jgi:hypothetical protein
VNRPLPLAERRDGTWKLMVSGTLAVLALLMGLGLVVYIQHLAAA